MTTHQGCSPSGAVNPLPAVSDGYDAARRWIADHGNGHPDILAVYEYGTVHHPGISDIDLFMVVSSSPQPGLNDRLTPTDCPQDCRALLDRATIKVAADIHFRDIPLLGSFRKRLICGTDMGVNHLSVNDARLAEIASVMDFLPERVLAMMALSKRQLLDGAELLGMLNSLRYSVEAADLFQGAADRTTTTFSNTLYALRSKWYAADDAERRRRLNRLVDTALAVGQRTIVAFTRFLLEAGYYVPPSHPAGAFFFSPDRGLRLVPLSEFEAMPPAALVEKRSDGCLVMTTPSIWAAHLSRYALLDGIISRRIAGNLTCPASAGRAAVRDDLADLLVRKMTLCNDMAAFFRDHGLPRRRLYRFAHIRRTTPDTRDNFLTTSVP